MTKGQKLELTWIGKENRPRLEPRILLEDPAKSYHAAHRVTDHDRFDNRLIFGDNLLAAAQRQFGQKRRATLSDHPIAIARSWMTTYRNRPKIQAHVQPRKKMQSGQRVG